MSRNPGVDSNLISRTRRSLTRLARFTNSLQRAQLSCGPVTVQQCHTLEALVDGPISMKMLSGEMALHQSTLTRVVEKLEAKQLVSRKRKSDNQRIVLVEITESGRDLYSKLDEASSLMIGRMLEFVEGDRRDSAVQGLELLCNLLDPRNNLIQGLISDCCCNELQNDLSVPSASSSPDREKGKSS